ncbi:hypothetical protein HMI56_001996 [Coelomomyces lativittatus]|nr:hypothetical protein HMI56_001996 [Coelomomyces lativittatus]
MKDKNKSTKTSVIGIDTAMGASNSKSMLIKGTKKRSKVEVNTRVRLEGKGGIEKEI